MSLAHTFVAGSLALRDPVKPAFALTLYVRFLTGLSRPLSTLDLLSRVYRPSRAAHQSVSPESRVSHTFTRWQCYIVEYSTPENVEMTSPAYTMKPQTYSNDRLPQSSTGSSLPPEGPWPFRHESRFAEHQPETARKTLSHSCGSSFKRQGTTLP